VRASTGGVFAPAALMAERRWLGAGARAREGRPGADLYARGRSVGVGGVTTVAHARVEW
jgi:hypothetical protein